MTFSLYSHYIHSAVNLKMIRHSRESGNPRKHWISGQARNDKDEKTYVVMHNSPKLLEI